MSRKRYTVEQIIYNLRDELLNAEICDTLFEARVLVDRWLRKYNVLWPHSSPGHIPPAPEAIERLPQSSGTTPYTLRQPLQD